MFDFLPKPQSVQQAERQARIWARAQSLTAEGYTLIVAEHAPMVLVLKPGNTDRQNADYIVNTETWECTCEDYLKHRAEHCCKHNLAAHAAWERAYTLHLEEMATVAEEMFANGWNG